MESRNVDPFLDGLREMITRRLVGGRPSIRIMSRTVAMSVRTLQRRLDERGWSYSELVDDVRRAVAHRRVAQPQTPFNVVAAELGFAEQASFTRAFRRWTGLTPREYRRRHRRAATRLSARPFVERPVGVANSPPPADAAPMLAATG